ncbi:MAG: hypothetical protein ABJE47_08510 [bacterium]
MRPAPRRAICALVALLAAAILPPQLRAQGGFLLQGVGDIELWKTDSASALLARGSGHLAPLFRGDVWSAIEPVRNLVLFGELWGEAGSARTETGGGVDARQYGIRYSPSDAFTFETGKIRQIVGAFSSRQLSFRNPLVGTPDGYATSYPYGARVDGSRSMVDYRIGVMSLPLYRPGYTPVPGNRLRAAIGAGITPTTGIRFGVSATEGPYLNDAFSPALLRAQEWTAYKQRIVAADAQVSRGYFEGHAELARSSYDIPGKPAVQGLLFYLEPKYTFSPRFYLAARYERNDYPFIGPATATIWTANPVVFNDAEIGGGFRPAAGTLLKLSVRADHWTPNASPFAPHDNGYAVVMQWSQTFDVMELLTPRR